jgi:hypothetical protein
MWTRRDAAREGEALCDAWPVAGAIRIWSRREPASFLRRISVLHRHRAAGLAFAIRTVFMDGLPLLTGIECVEALGRGGYQVRYRNNTVTVLERGSRMVVVPDVAELTPAALSGLLQAAGLSYAAFLALVASTNDADDVRTRTGMRLRYELSDGESNE